MTSENKGQNQGLDPEAEAVRKPGKGGKNTAGGKAKNNSANSPKDRDVVISKALSYLLRHGAVKEKLHIDDQGYIAIEELLQHNRMKCNKVTRADLSRIVETNDKQRFKITDDKICANQGHSIKLENAQLQEYTAENLPHEIYHGTYLNKLPTIVKSGGLSKMNRTHIHFTNSDNQISGIRQLTNILIYVDGAKILSSTKIKFYRSENGVILSGGDQQGKIPVEFWSKVVDRRTGAEIDIDLL